MQVVELDDELLTQLARKLETKTDLYKKEYEKIYESVSELNLKYKGVTASTFNDRINKYRQSFINAEKELRNFIKFLDNYANRIRTTEDRINARVSSLNKNV